MAWDVDIRLYSDSVSATHASIIRRHPGDLAFEVVDRGSDNGTFLNGERIPEGVARPLRVGEILALGRVELAVRGERVDGTTTQSGPAEPVETAVFHLDLDWKADMLLDRLHRTTRPCRIVALSAGMNVEIRTDAGKITGVSVNDSDVPITEGLKAFDSVLARGASNAVGDPRLSELAEGQSNTASKAT